MKIYSKKTASKSRRNKWAIYCDLDCLAYGLTKKEAAFSAQIGKLVAEKCGQKVESEI